MPTKDQVAFDLAQSHYVVEPGITQIFRLINDVHEDRPDEPIKLLEVSEYSLPVGIMPVYFHASAEFAYPSAIVEITPAEFVRLVHEGGDLRLPAGWRIGERIERSQAFQGSVS
jgi:hypothetical protein